MKKENEELDDVVFDAAISKAKTSQEIRAVVMLLPGPKPPAMEQQTESQNLTSDTKTSTRKGVSDVVFTSLRPC